MTLIHSSLWFFFFILKFVFAKIFWGKIKLAPVKLLRNGYIIIPKSKCTDTGFPGKQIIMVLLIFPTAIGLPGLIDALQKKSLPIFFKILIKWSSSPTEAPPVVIITSYLLIFFF